MARECFCGCGRKVERRHKGINKGAAEMRVLTGMVESHVLVFQRAYAEFAARRGLEAEEIAEARDGVADTEELIATARAGDKRIADVIHGDDATNFDEGELKGVVRQLLAMDANVRKYCFQSGLDYKKIPQLGPTGVVAFVEAQDAQSRS